MRNYLLGLVFVAVFGSSSAFAGPAVNNWTGLYVGAHVGGLWGDVDVTDNAADGVPPGPFPYSINGVFGGGTVGYNWQHQSLLIGIEGDLGYMDPDGEGRIPSSTPPNYQALTLDSGLYADITARLGVTFDHTLVYAKGGYAYFDGEAMQATTKPGYAPTGTDSFSGWVLGGGVEHFIAPNLSIKAEYLHFEFDTESGYQTSTIADPPTPIGYRFYNWHDVDMDTVKVGINYHFNAPEPAPLK